MSDTLVVNEVYLSLQGESTFAGLPCVFVRLTACNLRCSYCDTAYAFIEGAPRNLADIVEEIQKIAVHYAQHCGPFKLPLVELTGGEPLLQRNSLRLMRQLCDLDFKVLVETSGALDISQVDARVHRIMDLKCPSSGESERNRLENIANLKSSDEVKFVIGTREDYDWARLQVEKYKLPEICPVLFSWVSPLAPEQQHKALKRVPAEHHRISRLDLVEKIIADALPVRFQLQMHKFIWNPEQRGV